MFNPFEKKEIRTLVCPTCKTRFETKHPSRIFCCTECRIIHRTMYPKVPKRKRNRMAIFERDKFTCQICGNKGLEIHHKDKWQENNDPDNLILLCKDCHKKEHQND